MEYYLLEEIILPVRRFCRGLAARLGFRKSGVLMLTQEVQACEYEDVHTMWEMLKKTKTNEVTRFPRGLKNRPLRNIFAWTLEC